MNTDFSEASGRARHSVRAALRIYEFGGQRTARPTFYLCSSVSIRD